MKTSRFSIINVFYGNLKDNHGFPVPSQVSADISASIRNSSLILNEGRNDHIKKKSHLRFETPLGKQAQLDWKESIKFLLKSGEWIDINIFVLLLSTSRFRVYRLSLSKTQDILCSFIDDAFETFGGVPEELLTDNMKTVMDQPRTAYSKGKVNPRFAQFASDYGFKVRPCIAARPQTKAKVEAPMKLLDELYAYNGLLDYRELNQLVHKLNERINHAVHPETGRIPVMYLQKEKAHLSPLPRNVIRKPYQMTHTTVKVNSSCMITYRSNQYSVPPKYLGKRLVLQVYDNYLYVYYNTELIVIHPISAKKLNYTHDHYVAISKQTFKEQTMDIEKIAKENLTQIGAMFKKMNSTYVQLKKNLEYLKLNQMDLHLDEVIDLITSSPLSFTEGLCKLTNYERLILKKQT